MGKMLFVTNISFEATEDDMVRLFSVSGKVKSVKILTDPVNGKSKGCGFVEMSNLKEAKDAIDSLDDALFMERQISVVEARDSKPDGADKGAPGSSKGHKTFNRGRR